MLGSSRLQFATLALVCLLCGCSGFSLTVDKHYKQVPAGNGRDDFLCQADVPLVACQARKNFGNKPINGKLSSGNGRSGQCDFSISNLVKLNQFVSYGVRARAQNGAWRYETVVVIAVDNATSPLVVESGPRLVIAEPGTAVTLTFAAGEPLLLCSFKWPGQSTWVTNGSTSAFTIDNSRLAEGRCRLTLLKVQSDDSGIILNNMQSRRIDGKKRHIIELKTLIVKLAPSAPALKLNHDDGVYNEGDLLEASCEIGPARPVATISWLLDDDVIPGEAEDFSNWPWEYEAARTTRTLRRKLSVDDDGRVLTCRVYHIALPGGVVNTGKKISVRRTTVAPGAPALALNHEDGVYKEGDLMVASCKVGPARPLARVSWLLDDVIIEDDADEAPVYPPELKTGNITRTLRRKLMIDDDGKELTCKVHNVALPGGVIELRRNVTVLRTTDFASLDDCRVIWVMVGVGGSLLVVAVVVAALLIYARATERWCFTRPGTVLSGTARQHSNIYENCLELRSAPSRSMHG